ncbi:TPA: glycosyltransferase family 4 protein [Photobacterium damselae]|uniref:glycosyltransferase family 4 protein n=1 Tax=Photobacterium damselae TaxID=38293 RepID=UPI004067B65B
MEVISKDYDINLDVFYQYKREKERHWSIDPKTLTHNYMFSNNVFLGTPEIYSFNSFNIDLLKLDFSKYNYIIFSPLMSFNNLLLSLIIPKKKQIHWIESNLISTSSVSGIKYLIKKLALNRSDKFLIPGDNSKKYIELFNNKKCNKYINFPNLIDDSKYRNIKNKFSDDYLSKVRCELNISRNTRVFISIGEVCERKGSDKLLDIINNVKGDYVILLIGTGEYNELLLSSGLVGKKIKILGQLDNDEISKYLAISDIFLHLARRDPSPLVCIEALTSGMVMAVSKQTGNSLEVVNNNGVIFDINDDHDIYSKITLLVNLDSEKISFYKNESRKLADNLFRPKNVISSLYDFLVE